MRLTLKGQSLYFAPPQLSCSGMKFLYASLGIFSVTLFYTLLSYWSRSTIPFFFFFFFFKYVKRTRRDSSPVHAFPWLLLKMRSWLHGLFTLLLYSYWNMSLFCPSDGAQLPEATYCGWTQTPAKTSGKGSSYWEKNCGENNAFVTCATSNC